MTIIRKDTLQECKFNISIITDRKIKIHLNEFFT